MAGASEGTRTEFVERSYPGTTATLNQARGDVCDLLQAHELEHMTGDVQLVVSELTANAVDASPGHPYRVVVGIGGGHLTIAVTNSSSAEMPPTDEWQPDDVLALQGRGLSIVDALSSSVDVTSSKGEITVTARLVIAER